MTFDNLSETKIFNREKSVVEKELVYNQELKEKFYGTVLGRFIIHLLFKRKYYNKIYGRLQRTKRSKEKITYLIDKYHINTEEIELPVSAYQNVNEFFIRKLKPTARPIDLNADAFISPADCRLMVTPIQDEIQIKVKGRNYYYYQLIKNKELIRSYMNGLCLVYRLIPADYHRFCYIDDGYQDRVVAIKGYYQASAPQSLITRYFPLYHQNYREYCILHTKNFGEVIQIEVGAMTVGKIVQNKRFGGNFQKGEEKGYFEYGGSTIILLVKPNTIVIDEDILTFSQAGIETLVKYGSHIGVKSLQKSKET